MFPLLKFHYNDDALNPAIWTATLRFLSGASLPYHLRSTSRFPRERPNLGSQDYATRQQHTTSRSPRSIVAAVLPGLGLVILFVKLDEPAVRLVANLLGAARGLH
jgi:hypothetical protein